MNMVTLIRQVVRILGSVLISISSAMNGFLIGNKPK